jgi:D-3-phosphoglycerate dehydrogenase
MAVGRLQHSPGGEAIGVLNLDSPASEDALAKVAQVRGIDSVKMITLPAAGELPDWLT